MNETHNEIMVTAVRTPAEGMALLEKLTLVAQPEVVYSRPIQEGAYTVITASEVSVSYGFGFGGGGGWSPGPAAEGEEAGAGAENAGGENAGGGGGGGGGGASMARPVAVVAIGPDGVKVEPVMDVTKLGMAFLTAVGGIFLMFSRMRRYGREGR
jgi:uncharacterized spore protein YtfJ